MFLFFQATSLLVSAYPQAPLAKVMTTVHFLPKYFPSYSSLAFMIFWKYAENGYAFASPFFDFSPLSSLFLALLFLSPSCTPLIFIQECLCTQPDNSYPMVCSDPGASMCKDEAVDLVNCIVEERCDLYGILSFLNFNFNFSFFYSVPSFHFPIFPALPKS